VSRGQPGRSAPQPGTSKRAPGHKEYPYLLRKLAIERSNQVWALDTTYIPMACAFIYLTTVVDVAMRRMLAHKVALKLVACHARALIEQAFARWGTPEIVNTDQGRQFTATAYTEAVLGQGCKLSMDVCGTSRDNIFLDRLWRIVKYECVYLQALDGVSAARADIADYVALYNLSRALRAWMPLLSKSNTSPTCPRWRWRHMMNFLVRRVFPTASAGSAQAPTTALNNSAPHAPRSKPTERTGKAVQTSGATSGRSTRPSKCEAPCKSSGKTVID
jgi:transposase InsO family protein